MDSRSACIQGVFKVKVKVKGHVIRALFWILGMSYSVIDGLVIFLDLEGSRIATNVLFLHVLVLVTYIHTFNLLK